MTSSTSAFRIRDWRDGLVGSGLLFVLALYVRLIGSPTRPMVQDELLHLFSGRSWAQDGTFQLLDGEYRRAPLFTMLVGATFRLTGHDSLLTARLPAIIAGALVVAVLFYWLRRHVGLIAASVAALMLSFEPISVATSQFTRFYSIQTLLVIGASALLYNLRGSGRAGRIGLAVAAMGLALHLQITSIVPAAILAALAANELTADRRPALIRFLRDHRLAAAIALGVALAITALAAWRLAPYLGKVNRTSGAEATNPLFYLGSLNDISPQLTFLLPVAALLAFSLRPRLALLSVTMFAGAFVVHSLGGIKGTRFIAYVMPFFCALWGMAVQAALPAARALGQRLAERVGPMLGRPAPATRIATGVVLAVSGLSLLAGAEGYRDTVKRTAIASYRAIVQPASLVASPPAPPWSGRARALRAAIGADMTFISGEPLRSAYFIRKPDIWLAQGALKPGQPFPRIARNGLPVIGSPAEMRILRRCIANAVILVPAPRGGWNGVDAATLRAIDAMATRVRPAIPGFRLWRWRGIADNSDACRAVRGKLRPDRSRANQGVAS